MIRSALVALSIAVFAGCGKAEHVEFSPSVDCQPATAQILVMDGLLKHGCGCAEGIGDAATTLTCTVARGTMVAFSYTATANVHQIAPAEGSTSTLLTSPRFDPRSATPFRAFAVRVDEPGSYAFRDLYAPGVSGTLVVQ